ncbi:uncharacterized protein LOC114928970 [Nylanderia fulva]|uniref:uncharacterized protein LOC114928970 n=1 Tax=Nylanderia fulva TaxID=613905 RepID=UPI0010FBB120|nr:uncharacterized protein LOC114928970 [Nylanderia fulva]
MVMPERERDPGPGLRREGNTVYVCKAGILKKREPAVFYVDSYQKAFINLLFIHRWMWVPANRLLSLIWPSRARRRRTGLICRSATWCTPRCWLPARIWSLNWMLGRNQVYEIAAGMNGRIWIKARSVKETIAVANAILAAEYTLPGEMQKLCARIEKTLLLVA